MAQISLSTDCNGKAHIVTIGDKELFFSYQTLIAFRGMVAGQFTKVRLSNTWGTTTGRHFNELGAKNFDVVTLAEFNKIVGEAMGLHITA